MIAVSTEGWSEGTHARGFPLSGFSRWQGSQGWLFRVSASERVGQPVQIALMHGDGCLADHAALDAVDDLDAVPGCDPVAS